MKDSRQIMHTFSQLYLANEADALKHLDSLGITLQCTQTWLQVCTLTLVQALCHTYAGGVSEQGRCA